MILYRLKLLIVTSLFITSNSFAQYVSPLDCKLELSANYAEARSNHYHSGIDIRTEQREGIVVRSIADGYISRIGVAPWGFGRALYVTHPNGRTSVYAHLKSFNPEIEKYIAAERYKAGTHSINTFTPREMFPVKAGDKIGLSGNSGMSFGPHLHFEIRESATQKTLNPILVGNFNIPDNVPPRFIKVMYVAVDTIRGVPIHSTPKSISLKKHPNNRYTPNATTQVEVGRNGYFIVQVADSKNGSGSTNMAVSKIIQKFNDTTNFEICIDGFEFSNTRYVNASTDYVMQQTTRYDTYLLAKKQGNKMPIYGTCRNNGIISLESGERGKIDMEIVDDSGNKAFLTMNIIGGDLAVDSTLPKIKLIAEYDRPFSHSAQGATIYIPQGALYESIFYQQGICHKTSSPIYAKQLSPIYDIHKTTIPMHLRANFSIDASEVPARLHSKVKIAYLSKRGRWSSVGGEYKNGKVSAQIRSFGKYCIVADTIAPTIKPSFSKGANLRGSSRISFVIKDDFAGVAEYAASIDGKWILFEHDVLRNRITHFFDDKRTPKTGEKQSVSIEVRDGCGNKEVLETWFIR